MCLKFNLNQIKPNSFFKNSYLADYNCRCCLLSTCRFISVFLLSLSHSADLQLTPFSTIRVERIWRLLVASSSPPPPSLTLTKWLGTSGGRIYPLNLRRLFCARVSCTALYLLLYSKMQFIWAFSVFLLLFSFFDKHYFSKLWTNSATSY